MLVALSPSSSSTPPSSSSSFVHSISRKNWIVLASVCFLVITTFISSNDTLLQYSSSLVGGGGGGGSSSWQLLQGDTTKTTLPNNMNNKKKKSSPQATKREIIPNPSQILQRLLHEKYPECRLESSPSSSTATNKEQPQKIIDLASMGAYVKAASTTDPSSTAAAAASAPYDHISCFVMKARYNCAYRPDAPFQMAHHYELVLRLPQQQQEQQQQEEEEEEEPPAGTSTGSSRSSSTTKNTTTMVKKECRLKALIRDTLNEWNTALLAVKKAAAADDDDHDGDDDDDDDRPQHQTSKMSRRRRRRGRRHHVLLQGNSFVRQIWEALVCGTLLPSSSSSPSSSSTSTSTNSTTTTTTTTATTTIIPVTDFRVQVGGPDISLKSFTSRGNRLIRADELGDPLPSPLPTPPRGGGGGVNATTGSSEDTTSTTTSSSTTRSPFSDLPDRGCHGEAKSDLSAYYRRQAKVPPNIPNCNDNVAMMEWAHQWRFYYIFKPTMYKPEVLEKNIYQDRFGIILPTNTTTTTTGSADDDEYWLVWNSVLKEPQNTTPPTTAIKSRQSFDVNSWLWTLRDLQLRDLNNRYFGANNPFISKPPDFHACMPGTPDDQAHLLLYLLWSGYSLV